MAEAIVRGLARPTVSHPSIPEPKLPIPKFRQKRRFLMTHQAPHGKPGDPARPRNRLGRAAPVEQRGGSRSDLGEQVEIRARDWRSRSGEPSPAASQSAQPWRLRVCVPAAVCGPAEGPPAGAGPAGPQLALAQPTEGGIVRAAPATHGCWTGCSAGSRRASPVSDLPCGLRPAPIRCRSVVRGPAGARGGSRWWRLAAPAPHQHPIGQRAGERRGILNAVRAASRSTAATGQP